LDDNGTAVETRPQGASTVDRRAPDASRGPTTKWFKRRLLAVGGLVAAGFLSAVGAGIWAWSSDKVQDRRPPLEATVDSAGQCEAVVVPRGARESLPLGEPPDTAWAYQQGGGSWSEGSVRVTAQGRSADAVVLEGFVVTVLQRSELPPDPVILSRCDPPGRGASGAVSPRYYSLSLTSSDPQVNIQGEIPSEGVVDFPYVVSNSEPEVFYVSTAAPSDDCLCEWSLGLRWASGDESGVLTLDAGDGAVRTAVSTTTEFYKWLPSGEWVGPYDLDF